MLFACCWKLPSWQGQVCVVLLCSFCSNVSILCANDAFFFFFETSNDASFMLEQTANVLSWNVRGLNDQNRRATVSETIVASSCHLVFLQETKLAHVDQFCAAFQGGNRLCGYAQRPANGTRGGILMLWDDTIMEVKEGLFHDSILSLSHDLHSCHWREIQTHHCLWANLLPTQRRLLL